MGWKPIAKAWLESRTPQEIHVSIPINVNENTRGELEIVLSSSMTS